MADFKRRLRRLQILRLRYLDRQRRQTQALAGINTALAEAQRLLDELQKLRAHYVELEEARGMPAMTLSGIRRKLGELAEAHREQQGQVEWLQEERTRGMAAVTTLRLRVEHIERLVLETRTEHRTAAERAEALALAPRARV